MSKKHKKKDCYKLASLIIKATFAIASLIAAIAQLIASIK